MISGVFLGDGTKAATATWWQTPFARPGFRERHVEGLWTTRYEDSGFYATSPPQARTWCGLENSEQIRRDADYANTAHCESLRFVLRVGLMDWRGML